MPLLILNTIDAQLKASLLGIFAALPAIATMAP
jgi:hypothetical protein